MNNPLEDGSNPCISGHEPLIQSRSELWLALGAIPRSIHVKRVRVDIAVRAGVEVMQGGGADFIRVERQRNKPNLGWFARADLLNIAVSREP